MAHIMRRLKPSALAATAVLGIYILLLNLSSLFPDALRQQPRSTTPKRRAIQWCVHDPVPCPRLHYADRDADSLIDLANFTYLLDAPECAVGDDTTLLVLVHSAASHFAERDVIRTTWGAGTSWLKNVTLRVVFLLARTPGDPGLEERMARENHRHGDTVQGDFVDSYHNLTYKHVMALRWASSRCPGVPRVLKMDDDIFVHLFQLAAILDGPASSSMAPKSLVCYVQKQMPISRSEGSKWRVKESEYPGSFFEDYCSGWAYLADMAAVRAMAAEARFRPYFWVDDVHVTGTLARMGGVALRRINTRYTTEADGLALWAKPGGVQSPLLDWGYAFGPTWGDVALVARAHRKALWCRRNKCKCCFKATAPAATNGSSAKNAVVGRAVVHVLPGP